VDYQQGTGVPADRVQAYRWYEIAASNPDAPEDLQRAAIQGEEDVSAGMSDADIAKAGELAEEFAPQVASSD
jgi:TPR repeat protein